MRISQLLPHSGAVIKCKLNGIVMRALLYTENNKSLYLLQDYENGAQPQNIKLLTINQAYGTNFALSYFLGVDGDNCPANFEYISIVNGIPIKKKEEIKEGDRYVSVSGEVFIVANYHEGSGIVYFKDTTGTISKMLSAYDIANSLTKEKEFKFVDSGDYAKFYDEDLFSKMVYKKPIRFGMKNNMNLRPLVLKELNGGKIVISNEEGNQEITTIADLLLRQNTYDLALAKKQGIKVGKKVKEPILNGPIVGKVNVEAGWQKFGIDVDPANELWPWNNGIAKENPQLKKDDNPLVKGEAFEILIPAVAFQINQVDKEWKDVKDKAKIKIEDLKQKANQRKKNGFF